MKKMMILLSAVLVLALNLEAKKNTQTICFSKSSCSKQYPIATLGDKVQLCGGKCQGRSLLQMNEKGWKVVQVIPGLSGAFGMLLEKK